MAEALSFKVYNSALFAILFSPMVSSDLPPQEIKGGEQRFGKVVFLLFTAGLVVASYHLLIVYSVEAIHFIQYALLAIPVYALTLSFGKTVFWVTLMARWMRRTSISSFMQTTERCTSILMILCSISSGPA